MPLPHNLSDAQLLSQLRAGSNQGFTMLYRHIYPSVEHFVIQNSGSQEEAKDLFQETLVVLLTTIQSPDFQLTSSLKTYVFGISRNLWLKKLNKAARWTGLENAEDISIQPVSVELKNPPTVFEQVTAILAKLTLRCQTLLLTIFFQKRSITDIVQDEGYASVHSAQNQKYKCLQQARRTARST
ncbi:RNA polymerase sigma factor [Spirosoma linguale]|uniref:RNA polymerase, sigma-24 subunit, ECF subfamily n=1 Tax=Spirosoma linguale (strain ATCC 33905 / DSM 74 / LMG 10896 / Claus 1) TaxID=504472 RepID=D2QN77_SPILD|nr:RNA polymerase, sigma-24 subunit, ECF subfamily [Spirosoma linguale DSM 74]